MSGLLPSTPDLSRDPDPGPRVIGLESDDASQMLDALATDTARELLCALHEDPATPSALADRVDTSLQNAQYHLEKLESADLIQEAGTQYSEKGREMSIYAPTNGPLVVHPGDDEEDPGSLLKSLTGAVALLAGVALLAEAIAREWIPGLESSTPTSGDAARAEALDVAAETAVTEQSHWLVELVTGLSPGLAIFLGGLIVLSVAVAVGHRRGILVR